MFHVERFDVVASGEYRDGMSDYDVLVIGAGHAGCEAAAAAARTGARTALVSLRRSDAGVLSCNPAIGGLGKGHLVREIDALDGLMGRVTDAAAVQYRLLNRSKGPAVQGPRAQVDRRRYAAAMHDALTATVGLPMVEANVQSLVVEDAVVIVDTNVGRLLATAVVITTGTFLNATMYAGQEMTSGGRVGSLAPVGLAASLHAFGLPMARLKTGTPPRLDGRTIDWSRLDWQVGDDDPTRMSDIAAPVSDPQLPCAITRSNAATHDVVRRNLHLAPRSAGLISGIGPRYCPSFEDKVERFGDRDGHQVFLEPEGYDSNIIYPNGLSTSLPIEVQRELVATIKGLEQAVIVQPGYAVEYDHVDPRALTPGLACIDHPRVFLAGQINGTTGYEEAAAQGLVAGTNAARAARGDEAHVFDRASSYIGVMIDDLVTQGVSEPYRMFTSRAEYRLRLRTDNAAQRLTPIGIALDVVGAERQLTFKRREHRHACASALLDRLSATPAAVAKAGVDIKQDGRRRSATEWLQNERIDWAAACRVWPELSTIDRETADVVAVDARYAMYLGRQDHDIDRMRRDEAVRVPASLAFNAVPGLSTEMVERLSVARPASVGAAARIPGITPGALLSLLSYVKRAA